MSGLTTFLTMLYILSANSAILSETGMPWHGVFVATALVAGFCTIFVALYANLPLAMAPGMGLNTVFAYTLCLGMGYHWKEALAISFLAGVLHIIIMSTRLRKALVSAFPEYLRVAAGAGLGMFIAYVGLKNTGLLVFSFPAGQYEQVVSGAVASYSSVVPGLTKTITDSQIIAVIGFIVMIVLMALEKKTQSRYAALSVGILVATFIGIPMNVTKLNGIPFSVAHMTEGFGEIFLSFFGRPGLLSIFESPTTASRTVLMICVIGLTGILDSVGTMIGVGQIHNARLFDETDMEKFAGRGAGAKLDKALISNSIGNALAPVFGASTTTIYLESVTGIVSGGRTGLTALTAGLLFLLCLPLYWLFHIIPGEAVAPALILAGVSMLTRMRFIDWKDFEQSFPAFVTILFMTLSYSILDGIVIGIICHVLIQTVLGKRREVHPILFIISVLYLGIKFSENYIFR